MLFNGENFYIDHHYLTIKWLRSYIKNEPDGEFLKILIEQLPDRYSMVLFLRIYKNKPCSFIAKEMNVSRCRIDQMSSKGLRILANKLLIHTKEKSFED